VSHPLPKIATRESESLNRHCRYDPRSMVFVLRPSRNATKSNVENLEHKLDGLVSLIKSTQDHTLRDVNLGQHFPTSTRGSSISTQRGPTSPPGFAAAQTGLPGNPQQPSHELDTAVPDFVEANILLNFFRDEMIPKFPFIALPPGISAEKLYATKPFLYISILAVTVHDSAQQITLGKRVMGMLAKKMFVSGERSLDLLLGILTYAGWQDSISSRRCDKLTLPGVTII